MTTRPRNPPHGRAPRDLPTRVVWGVRAAAAMTAVARLGQGASRRPALRPVRPGEGVATTVSVVIPARDEEARIAPCLVALRADPQVHEVIVVDDQSTDSTATLAAALGARVVPGMPLPDGWVGKPWALQQGLEAATGEWVLTLDADTRPTPGLVAALLDAADAFSLDLVSAGGRFDCGTLPLQVLHPALLATLLYRFAPPGSRLPARPGRVVVNGQCLLARRRPLVAAGGFGLAAGYLTDDIALGRRLAARGWRTAMLDGAAVLEVRMHDGAVSAWHDWGRSLPMPDVTSAPAMAADLAVLWLSVALPQLRLAAGRADRLDAVLLALRLALVVALRGSYVPPRGAIWLSPLADVPAVVRVTWGALLPGRSWRGRTYAAAARP